MEKLIDKLTFELETSQPIQDEEGLVDQSTPVVELPYLLQLRDIVGAEKAIEIAPQFTPQDVPYISALTDIVGVLKAVKIASKYSAQDIIGGETLWEEGTKNFKSKPKTAKGKLEQVIQFVDWKNNLGECDWVQTIGNMTNSFPQFRKLVQNIEHAPESPARFLQNFKSASEKLVWIYGVPVSADLPKNSHVDEPYMRKEGEPKLKALPGITTQDLMTYIINMAKEGREVNSWDIYAGWNDIFAALEASALETRFDEKRNLLLNAGYRSVEKIHSAPMEKLEEFKTLYDYGYRKDFYGVACHAIVGKDANLDRLIKLGKEHEDAKLYLKAFDGSISQTERFFNLPKENRPSPQSIMLARRGFGIFDFHQALHTAEEIDGPYIKTLGFLHETEKNVTVRKSRQIKSKEDFFAAIQEYNDKKEEYHRLAKDVESPTDFSTRALELIHESDIDPRYIIDCGWFRDRETLEAMNEAMPYETYKAINISGFEKEKNILNLLENGYKIEELVEAFKDHPISTWDLERAIQRNPHQKIPLKKIAMINNMHMSDKEESEFLWYTETIPFEEHNIPYSLIRSFSANGIQPFKVMEFADAVGGFPKYISDEGFQTMDFLRDLKEFYGVVKAPKKNKQDF